MGFILVPWEDGRMRFTEEKMPDGQQILIKLQGNLMEADARFPRPASRPGISYMINVDELKAINSIGIRAFMDWMRELGDAPITFMNCPKFFIDQVNMVADFIPRHARVHSFYVPFYSEANETDRMVLYRTGLEFLRSDGRIHLRHPADVVDVAGSPMELDVISDRFFKFLEKHG